MPGDHPEYDGRVKYSLHSFASIYLFLFFTYYKRAFNFYVRFVNLE